MAVIALVFATMALIASTAALGGVIWILADRQKRGRLGENAVAEVASFGPAQRPAANTAVPHAAQQSVPAFATLVANLKTPPRPQGGFGSKVTTPESDPST